MSPAPRNSIPAYTMPRRWPRHRITAPILVEFASPDGRGGHLVAGSTRDISAGGVYVVSQEPVNAGTAAQLYMACPGREAPLNTAGVIVRCEPKGFAIAFSETVEEMPGFLGIA